MVSQQATWQAWRVAFYLESRRWLNSVVRTLQNPIGLLTTILALLIAAALVWAFFPQAYWIQPNDPSQRIWQETSSQERLQRRPSPTLWEGLEVIPIASAYLTKTRIDENPLLKVPPARRGNRVGARRGSPREAGGNLWRRAIVNSERAIGITFQAQDATLILFLACRYLTTLHILEVTNYELAQ